MQTTINALDQIEMDESLVKIESNDSKYTYFDFKNLNQESLQKLTSALNKNRYVAGLYLQGNDIDDNGVKALAKLLERHQFLSILGLKDFQISDIGAKAIAQSIELSDTIASLKIRNHNISFDGAKALIQASKTNKQLSLDISSEVNLKYEEDEDGEEDVIDRNEVQEFIYIREGENEYKELKISDVISDIANNSRNYIDVTFEQIDKTNLQNLCNALISNQLLTVLRFSALDEIMGGKAEIGDEGVKVIAEALKMNQSINTLSLARNKICDEGAIALQEALKINESITSLDLSSNNISYEGAKAIAEALKVNKSITILDLRSNNISYEGAKAIAEALKVNKSITSLSLHHNNITDEGAKVIAGALKVNKSIISLFLGFNNIRDEGAKEIVEALEVNKSITSLDLKSNNISDEGAKAISKSLKVNKSITSLDLSFNNISDEGAKEIAEALKINKSITQLLFGNNKISDEGYGFIAQSLEHNKYVVNTDSIDIRNENSKLIKKYLKRNLKILEDALEIVFCEDIKNFKNLISEEQKQVVINILGNEYLTKDLRYLVEDYYNLSSYNKLPVVRNKFKSYLLSTALDSSHDFDKLAPELKYLVKKITYPKSLNLNLNQINDLVNLIPKTETETNLVMSYFRNSNMDTTPEDINELDKMLKASENLKKLLYIPNNIIFLKDALNKGRKFSDFTDNLKAINANEEFLEFIKQNPKKLGYLVSSKPEELPNRIQNLSNNYINKFSANEGYINVISEVIGAGEKRKRTDSLDSNDSKKFQKMVIKKEISRKTLGNSIT